MKFWSEAAKNVTSRSCMESFPGGSRVTAMKGKAISCFGSFEKWNDPKQVVALGLAHSLPSDKIEFRFTVRVGWLWSDSGAGIFVWPCAGL
jgi:hypothetical protein